MNALLFIIVFLYCYFALAAITPHRRHGYHHRSCHLPVVECDFVVIGGGPGGSFTAYKLQKHVVGTVVCLIEQNAEPGGRFLDIQQRGGGGGRIPMGGMRWYEFGNATHQLFTALADELGISRHADLETDVFKSGHRYTEVRGASSVDPAFRELNARYTDALIHKVSNDTSDALYNAMIDFYGNNITATGQFGSLGQFASSLFNFETLEFLRDTNRYRSDFNAAIDVPSYLNAFLWDSRFDGPRTYPDGGMSEFCRKMLAKVEQWGGKLYYLQRVKSIEYDRGMYTIETNTTVFLAPVLAVAVPGTDLAKIAGGNVAAALKATPFYEAYFPIEVAIVGQVWPRRWWEESQVGFTCGQAVLQGGFNSYAHLFCSTTPYGYHQNLTRSVYCDGLNRVLFWQHLHATQGIEAVAQESLNGLGSIYPDVEIPAPTTTLYHHHSTAWSWLKAGSFARNITVDSLLNWSVNPLPNVNPCSLVLPSDSWNVGQSAWGAASLSIAVKWLSQCHNIQIENSFDYCKPYQAPPLNQTWCDCNPTSLVPPEGVVYRQEHCPFMQRTKRPTYHSRN